MVDAKHDNKRFISARQKFLGLSLESTRKSYYPQLKEHLEIVKENERLLRLLIDNLPARISYVDAQERYVFVNREYEKVFKLKRSQIEGQRVQTILGRRDYHKVKPYIQRALSGEQVHIEMPFISKKGNVLWLELRLVPDLSSKGDVNGYYGLILDLTEKKRIEEDRENLRTQLTQAQKMESIGTLAGGIAHDFNNILSIIIGNTELALDDVPVWNPAWSNLNEIKTAGMRAKDMVRQLLSFSRKADREKRPLSIAPLIGESLKLLRASIPAAVEIRSHLPDNAPPIKADPTQIQQVVINLCTNAAHAMEPDGGLLDVRLIQVDKDVVNPDLYGEIGPGPYIQLSVSDTGHGIDPQIKDRIFDPYFTTKEVGKGSGMGLSIVHGIVMNHGGALSVSSTPGKGTTVVVWLPVSEAEKPVAQTEAEHHPGGDESILFVDDEASITKMTRKMLEKLGYDVETRMRPEEALALLDSDPGRFDLIITDMSMPGMTGVDLFKKVVEIRNDLPVILCTGHSARIDPKEAQEMGIAAYIMKPPAISQMARTIRDVLDSAKRLGPERRAGGH